MAVANGRIRREQKFRDQQDPLTNSDEWLMDPALERSTHRNHTVSVLLQVLTTLGFQPAHSRGNWLTGISHPTFYPCYARRVRRYNWFVAAVHKVSSYFGWTRKNAQFAAMSGFPNVIGTTNCTHVAIRAPSENELDRHRCPPAPPSPCHSGGIPWWSPVFHPAGWALVGPFPDALPVWRQVLFCSHFYVWSHFLSLRPHSDLLRQQHLNCLQHAATLEPFLHWWPDPTLCPPNNTAFLFSTSPTRTSTSHWVKLHFFAFLSAICMLSVINEN